MCANKASARGTLGQTNFAIDEIDMCTIFFSAVQNSSAQQFSLVDVFKFTDIPQRRSERLPTVHCDCVSSKMAEFSLARRVFTVFLCVIFTGLES